MPDGDARRDARKPARRAGRPGPLERAKALVPLIAEDAREAERLGRLTDRVAQSMMDAKLFSMLLPEAADGDDVGRVGFFETVEAISQADGAAGWCLSVCSSMNDFLYKGLPAEGRAEVFADGPTACWASLLPRAKASEAKGGFHLSGSFNMGSGSSLSSWVTVSEPITDRDGRQWFRAHVARKSDVSITPGSWDAMGLRATASVDYTIDEAFIPKRRTFEYPFLQGPESPVSTQYGAQLNQIGLTAFTSGLGLRALAELSEAAPTTKRLLGEGALADDGYLQFGIGELDGRVRAARGYFLDLLAAQDTHIAERGGPDPRLAIEISQGTQTLARASRDLVVFVFDHSGMGVVMASHPIQRCLRDIFTGLKHAAFTLSILTRTGKSRLGVSSEFSRLR